MIWLLNQANSSFYIASSLLSFWGILYVYIHFHARRSAKALLVWGIALVVLSLQPFAHALAARSPLLGCLAFWAVQTLGTALLLAGAAEQRFGTLRLAAAAVCWGAASALAAAALLLFGAQAAAVYWLPAVFAAQSLGLASGVAAFAWKDRRGRHWATYGALLVFSAAAGYCSVSLFLTGDIALYQPVAILTAILLTALLAFSALMEANASAKNGKVRLETLVEYSTHGMAFIDDAGIVEWANRRMLELTGASLPEGSIRGASTEDIGLAELLREHMRTNSGEIVVDFDRLNREGRRTLRSGKARFQITVRAIPGDADIPGGLFVQLEDVTQLRDTINELIEKRPQFEMMLEAAKAYGFVIEGTALYAESLLKSLGYDCASMELGDVRELIHPQDRQRYDWDNATFESVWNAFYSNEVKIRDSDGNYTWFLASSRFVTIDGRNTLVGMAVNIDHHKRMESYVMQCERLAAVGQLANGVAHDISNQLLTIQTALSLLTTVQDEEQRPKFAQYMQEAIDNCTGTLARLVSFSKGEEQAFEPVDMESLMSSFKSLLARSLGADVRLAFSNEAGGAYVLGDYYELQNAFMNIGLNARDALPESGGEIVVKTWLRVRNPLKPGDPRQWYYFSIQDNGCGMSPEVQKRIFDPFFTTKPHGKGNGLGLYTTYGSIQHHQGTISVDSEQGAGTLIVVALPVADVDENGSDALPNT